jgi:hypothetical protein
MRDGPNRWTINQIAEQFRTGDGMWAGGFLDSRFPEPARPLGPTWLSNRFRLAWAVFTGRADALFWPNQQNDIPPSLTLSKPSPRKRKR